MFLFYVLVELLNDWDFLWEIVVPCLIWLGLLSSLGFFVLGAYAIYTEEKKLKLRIRTFTWVLFAFYLLLVFVSGMMHRDKTYWSEMKYLEEARTMDLSH